MNAKLIKTEADYEAALARLDAIFGAEPGTPEGDEAELLTALIEMYEEKAYPMGMPTPVEAIRFRMEQQGLKQKDLLPFFGSESKVSEVLSGKRPLSLSMIRRLVNDLGIPAEVLLQEPGAQLSDNKQVQKAARFPVAEMAKRGWFAGFSGTVREAKGQLEDLMAAFVAPLGSTDLQLVCNRQFIRSGKACDEYALLAWRIRVVTLAQKEKVAPYRKGSVTQAFLRELATLSYLNDGPKLAKEFLAKAGIPLVFERHLDKTYLDGAAIPLPDGRPVIAMTLRHDRLDNFWFTLFHELAHVALHLDHDGSDAFFDEISVSGGQDAREKEADVFAAEALIPSKAWSAARLTLRSKEENVRALAEQLRISPSIPAGRLRYASSNYKKFTDLIGNKRVRVFFEANESL